MERRVSDSDTDPVYLSVNTYTSAEDEVVGEVSDAIPVYLYHSVNACTSVSGQCLAWKRQQ